MKQGIVVCTWSGGQLWADLCLKSLEPLYNKYPIYVVINDASVASASWIDTLRSKYSVFELLEDARELGAIKCITEFTDLDEFWLFQDSVEILDPSFILVSFEKYPGASVSYHANPMQYYMGKWRVPILKMIDIPIAKTKIDAIQYEDKFYNFYKNLETDLEKSGIFLIDPIFHANNTKNNYIEPLFGEERLVIVGKYLLKRLSLGTENLTNLVLTPEDPVLTEEKILRWRNSFKSRPRSSMD